MLSTTSQKVTDGVAITVKSQFVPEQSSQENGTYVFAYRISIVNDSDVTVQLLRRHWDIVDAHQEHRVVEGAGVIGQQPVLYPGERHTYMSGAVLQTPIGKMGGYYTMLRLDTKETFRVEIPTFLLIPRFFLN